MRARLFRVVLPLASLLLAGCSAGSMDAQGKGSYSTASDAQIFDPGEMFLALDFQDVNFDGFLDIVATTGGTLNEAHDLYIWDAPSQKYIKVTYSGFDLLSYFEVSHGVIKNWVKSSADEGVVQTLMWEGDTLTLKEEAEYSTASETVTEEDETAKEAAPAVCNAYYSAGQVRRIAYIVSGDDRSPANQLTANFFSRNTQFKDAWNLLLEAKFNYQPDIRQYALTGSDGAGKDQTYGIYFDTDYSFTLEGDGPAAGDYCDWKTWSDQLILPDSLERLLNETDLIGMDRQTLRLLRNQFFATYGRKFLEDDLRTYFEKTSWYRGLTEPWDFDYNALNQIEKKNVELIKYAEKRWDEKEAQKLREAYGQLPPAPYVELLPDTPEIGMKFGRKAEDRGLYYCVLGTVSIPITLSKEQYETAETGQTVKVTVNELTHETAYLKKLDGDLYYNYQLAADPQSLGDENSECRVILEEGSYDGGYSMRRYQTGTVMKPVYEGEIYVLKGACWGTGYRLGDMADGSGSYQTMVFDGNDSDYYQGNCLFLDQKGYVKGVFFLQS